MSATAGVSFWDRFVSIRDAPSKAPLPWAFFTLKTGVPGSGKSLTFVRELQLACAGENPPVVYVHNIPDLALPHIPLPVYNPVVSVKGDDGKPHLVFSRTLEVDWASVVPGSLVVIDEAQNVFPVRSSAGKVPGYVSFLNTHRHKPVLIVLMTQHPKLIDQAVRKLISKHQHYRRVFGGQRHVCYEWDACSENLSGMKEATKRVSSFPKKAFAAYKSAEAHTKPKFALPVWLIVPVLAVLGLLAVAPTAYRKMTGAVDGGGLSSAPGGAAAAVAASASRAGIPGARPGPPGVDLARLPPRVVPVASSVPAPVDAAASAQLVAQSWPAVLAGCWIADTCVCTTNEPRVRVLRGLGTLCVDVAMGRLVVDSSRPLPAAPAASGPSTAVVPGFLPSPSTPVVPFALAPVPMPAPARPAGA